MTTPNVTTVLKSIRPGRFFSVVFVKRTTGELRTMICRTGVTKYLVGGELNYDPEEKGLIIVWSPDSKGKHGPKDVGYRAVPYMRITQITAGGTVYNFEPTEIEHVASNA